METANYNTHTFLVPSGLTITIREQNGEDDDVLSNAKHTATGMSIINFLHGIILSVDGVKPTKDDLMKMRIRDRSVILITTRIFSIGQVMSFEYDWKDGSNPVAYEEDLSKFIWDYSLPFPEQGSKDYLPERIKPYKDKDKPYREITLTSGKKLQYDYYNSKTELYVMDLPLEKQSINKEFLARNLKLKVSDDWVTVQNFSTFSKTDMRELWSDLMEFDEPLRITSELEHPDKDDVKTSMHLMSNPSFFFPARI